MTKGICRSTGCPAAAAATPVERYPGPGEYCPECGELLDAVDEKPFGGLTPLQALQRFEAENAPVLTPSRPRRSRKPLVFASIAVVIAAAGSLIAFHPVALSRSADAGALRICRSSISERFAFDVVAAYSAKTRIPAAQFAVAHGNACDVRFSAVATPDASGTVVGHDAIVAVVNPQNPLTRLTASALRGVLSGEITDWSQLGGRPGRILVAMPNEASDEGAAIGRAVLAGAHVASSVQRFGSTADVVAAVAGPRGRATLGVVAFSGAVPAKVLRLGSAPAPSMISISDQGYPLTVAIAVEAVGTAPPALATGLVRYARSDDAQAIVARDGLVPLKGF